MTVGLNFYVDAAVATVHSVYSRSLSDTRQIKRADVRLSLTNFVQRLHCYTSPLSGRKAMHWCEVYRFWL